MPRIDNLNSPDTDLPGQIADLQRQIHDLARNNPVGAGGLIVGGGNSVIITGGGTLLVNGTDIAALVTKVSNNQVLAAQDSTTLTLTANLNNFPTIYWDANTSPAISFTSPYSFALVEVGCLIEVIPTGSLEDMTGYLGFGVDGVAPSTDFRSWPGVVSNNTWNSANPKARVLSTALITVTPNVLKTVTARYGWTSSDSSPSGITALFTGRFLTVTPIPS